MIQFQKTNLLAHAKFWPVNDVIEKNYIIFHNIALRLLYDDVNVIN